jgi:hypothetical protein
MLIDPELRPASPMVDILSNGVDPKRLTVGVYLIGHFSCDTMLSRDGGNLHDDDEWDPYCEELPGGVPCYGVCDSVGQFMEKFGDALKADAAAHCLSFTRIAKDEQSPVGGWRWHKWGPYVGNGEPMYEYLYDEPKFTEVYVFHVFRKRTAGPAPTPWPGAAPNKANPIVPFGKG